ncbi:hypothetical protein CRE_19948 [Caenorhabditis remanei]|uniref:Uncharacterized protein n=1 Tax=Caenorhabditis remanei TaxID=31234 RepID=E3N8G5_CAERE|nr:hypothetical protein CRE_19948 [Caenorhabditis remanei]
MNSNDLGENGTNDVRIENDNDVSTNGVLVVFNQQAASTAQSTPAALGVHQLLPAQDLANNGVAVVPGPSVHAAPATGSASKKASGRKQKRGKKGKSAKRTTQPAPKNPSNAAVRHRKTEAERLKDGLDEEWFNRSGTRSSYANRRQSGGVGNSDGLVSARNRLRSQPVTTASHRATTTPNNTPPAIPVNHIPLVPVVNAISAASNQSASNQTAFDPVAPPSPPIPVVCRQESLPPKRDEYDVPLMDQLELAQHGVAKLDEDEFSSARSTLPEVRAPTMEDASVLLEQVTDPQLLFMVLALVPLFKCLKPYRDACQGLDLIFDNFGYFEVLQNAFNSKAVFALRNFYKEWAANKFVPPAMNGGWTLGCSMRDVLALFKLVANPNLSEVLYKLGCSPRRGTDGVCRPILDDIIDYVPRRTAPFTMETVLLIKSTALLLLDIQPTLERYAKSEIAKPIPVKPEASKFNWNLANDIVKIQKDGWRVSLFPNTGEEEGEVVEQKFQTMEMKKEMK